MRRSFPVSAVLASLTVIGLQSASRGENRSIDGTGNHVTITDRGAAVTPMIRFGYGSEFVDSAGGMISDELRANARDISNALFAQSASVLSARNLSDYIWAWGQFVSHDTDLISTSDGPAVNGAAPIAVNDPLDSIGPNPIPFTRANFVELSPPRGSKSGRTPINYVTSYIDASNVYGSNATRAAALRADDGIGAKLLTSADNLLPYNTAGLPVENNGPLPDNQLFLAGDIRSNENSLLASLHTLFVREHNRLVDVIKSQQPNLDSESQYQLARKIVGAEMQIITYREFLPALLGSGTSVPSADDYNYSPQVDASITTAFAHAAFRYGHSTVSSQLQLVDADGVNLGNIEVQNAFYNPGILGDAPETLDLLLRGAATQRSEEVDVLMVDELRNFLFGPPGAGGLDLAALNIQRGRDVGMPNYRQLSLRRNLDRGSFAEITADQALRDALAAVYADNIDNVDAWVGMLAEDHVPGASVGPLLKTEIESQFLRLRDGDRLFYLGPDAGLYTDGLLNPEIAAIIDLDSLRLSDVILANTTVGNLQRNVFFVSVPGDYNLDGTVDAADYVVWRKGLGTTYTQDDYDVWRSHFGQTAGNNSSLASAESLSAAVPETSTLTLMILAAVGWPLYQRHAISRTIISSNSSTGGICPAGQHRAKVTDANTICGGCAPQHAFVSRHSYLLV
jgi:peroxidase